MGLRISWEPQHEDLYHLPRKPGLITGGLLKQVLWGGMEVILGSQEQW